MKTLSLPVAIIVSLVFLVSCTADRIISDPSSGGVFQRGPRAEQREDGAKNTHAQSDRTRPLKNTSGSMGKSTVASPAPASTETETPLSSSITMTSEQSNISKSVTYTTDHGKEGVAVIFSLTTDAAGVITSVSANAPSADRESRQYISRFNSAAKSQIIGKKISSLSLSAVGGASDTTDAFVQIIKSL